MYVFHLNFRSFRDIRPKNDASKNSKSWWMYAYKCVMRQRVTLFWHKIQTHRFIVIQTDDIF